MSKLLHLLPVGLLMSAVPANAVDFFGEHAGWEVYKDYDTCGMIMEYAGAGETRLLLSKGLDNKIGVLVSNYGWSAVDGKKYEMSYLLNGTAYGGTSHGLLSGSRAGFAAFFGEGFGSDLAQGQSLRIFMGDTLVDDLSLSGSAKAISLVDRCLTEVRNEIKAKEREEARLAHIPKDPFARGNEADVAERVKVAPQPPTPRSISVWGPRINENYPSEALRNQWQGSVGIVVKIDQLGRVAECSISKSSGYPALDSAACNSFRRYGRFNPATDENGQSTEGSYSTEINYKL